MKAGLDLSVIAILCFTAGVLPQPPPGIGWRRFDDARLEGDVLERDRTQVLILEHIEIGNEAQCARECSAVHAANAYVFCKKPTGCGSGCLQWRKKYPGPCTMDLAFWYSTPDRYDAFEPTVGCQGALIGHEVDQWPYCMCTCLRVKDPSRPAFAPASLPRVGQWQCMKNLQVPQNNTPVRWNGAEPQCTSVDGQRCWRPPSGCAASLRRVQSATVVQPVACGPHHKALWGSDGYRKGSWCSAARAAFVPASGVLPPSGTWRCVKGLPAPFTNTPVRWVGQHPQCASLDGRACLKPACCQTLLTSLLHGPLNVSSLTCGPYHQSVWSGYNGYKPTNWCTAARKAMVPHSGWQSGIFTLPAASSVCATLPSATVMSTCLRGLPARQRNYVECHRGVNGSAGAKLRKLQQTIRCSLYTDRRQAACVACLNRPATSSASLLDKCWRCARANSCSDCLTGPDTAWSEVPVAGESVWNNVQQQGQCVDCVLGGTLVNSCLWCLSSKNVSACATCARITDKCPNCGYYANAFQCGPTTSAFGPERHVCLRCLNGLTDMTTDTCTTCKFWP